jgi:hypothetical protein
MHAGRPPDDDRQARLRSLGGKMATIVSGCSSDMARPVRPGATARPAAPVDLADPATLCHELRTPMNAVLGYAELLLDGSAGPLGAEARQYCGHIQAAGRRLGDLIDALMLLADTRRAGPGRADLPIDLVRLLADALADASSPGCRVDTVPASARLDVRGDARLLAALGRASGHHQSAGDRPGPLTLVVAPCDGRGLALTVAGLRAFSGSGDGAILEALAAAVMAAHRGSASVDDAGSLTLAFAAA